MNTIQPILEQSLQRGTSSSSDQLFFVTGILGFGCLALGYVGYQMLASMKRVDVCEEVQDELERQMDELHENVNTMFLKTERLETAQQAQKKDVIEDKVYQVWNGDVDTEDVTITIRITREKNSTAADNEKWCEWAGEQDASVIVRDFYLGNIDFSLFHVEGAEATLQETMVNGWTSVIHVFVKITKKQTTEIQLNKESFYAVLQHCIREKKIQWIRTLLG